MTDQQDLLREGMELQEKLLQAQNDYLETYCNAIKKALEYHPEPSSMVFSDIPEEAMTRWKKWKLKRKVKKLQKKKT